MLGTVNMAQFQQMQQQAQVVGPDQKPGAWSTVQDPTVSYASQASDLTPERDRSLAGKVEVLKANERLFSGWNAVAGGPPAPGAPMTPPPPKEVPVQLRNEHVQVASLGSRAPLVQADDKGRLQGDKAVLQAFTAANTTHEMFEGHLGRDFGYQGTAGGRLTIRVDDNDMSSLLSGPHYKVGQGVVSLPGNDAKASADPDVVSHEAGHAILDAHRPAYSRMDSSTRKMHESFGDTTSMLAALRDKDVRADVLAKRAQGSDSNLASNMGEGLQAAEDKAKANLTLTPPPPTEKPPGHQSGLRNLAAEPPSGPEHASEEDHTGSTRFSSAVYRSVLDVEAQIRKENPGVSADDALRQAADRVGSDFARTLDFLPGGNVASQSDLARAMMRANEVDGSGDLKGIYAKNFEAAHVPVRDANAGLRDAGLKSLTSNADLAAPAALTGAAPAERLAPTALNPKPTQPAAITAADGWLAKNAETLGVAGGNLRAQDTYRNARGETWVRFTNGQSPTDRSASETLRVGFDAKGGVLHADPQTHKPEPPPMLPGFPPVPPGPGPGGPLGPGPGPGGPSWPGPGGPGGPLGPGPGGPLGPESGPGGPAGIPPSFPEPPRDLGVA